VSEWSKNLPLLENRCCAELVIHWNFGERSFAYVREAEHYVLVRNRALPENPRQTAVPYSLNGISHDGQANDFRRLLRAEDRRRKEKPVLAVRIRTRAGSAGIGRTDFVTDERTKNAGNGAYRNAAAHKSKIVSDVVIYIHTFFSSYHCIALVNNICCPARLMARRLFFFPFFFTLRYITET